MKKEKKEAVRPAETVKEDNSLYIKLMVAFSVVQLVLAMVLYITSALQPPVWAVLGVVMILLIVLSVKYLDRSKPMRVILRVVTYLISLLALVPIGVEFFYILAIYGAGRSSMTFAWQNMAQEIALFAQTVLLFMLPVFAVGAMRGRRFDVNSMRVFSVLQLGIALLTCFYVIDRLNTISLNITNMYYNIFYCLCVAVTAVASFVINPVHLPFGLSEKLAGLAKKRGHREEEQSPVEAETIE